MLTRRKTILVAALSLLMAAPLLWAQSVAPGDTLSFGTEADYPPLSFQNKAGEVTGFNVSLTRALIRATDLQATITMKPWAELRRELGAGGVDVIAGMYYSEARDELFDFSQPYLVVHHVLFGRDEAPEVGSPEQLAGKTVLAMQGDIAEEYLRGLGLPGLTVVTAPSVADAVRRLAAGEGDYALVARLPGLYHLHDLGAEGIRERSKSLLSANYCYAVREGSGDLLATITEGLVVLERSGEYREIFDEWLGVYAEPRAWARTWPFLLYVGAPLLLIALGTLAWSRSQRALVNVRTRDLRAEIQAHKDTEHNLEHANLILETIRLINHKSAGTTSAEELAGYACDLIVASEHCSSARISLMDGAGRPPATVGSHPEDPRPGLGSGREWEIEKRLEYGGRLHGRLLVTVSADESSAAEVEQLIGAAAEELSYGLHSFYLSQERRRLQELLKDASIIVESSPMVLFRWNAGDGWPVDYVSQNVRQFGYEPEDLTSGRILYRDLILPEDLPTLTKEVARHFAEAPGDFVTQYRIVRGDGAVRWVEDRTKITVGKDGEITKLEGIVFDVTNEVEHRENLRAAVKQRETLLQELYHRTKNNMQVIASMVALRNMSIADSKAREILQEIENKIYAMALVHTKLYQSRDISELSLDEYLTELAQLVLESHDSAAERISVAADTEPVSCLIDTAVPLGLVAAELLTNSLKHAFPGNRSGTLSLRLRRLGTGELRVEIADNGVGFPDAGDPEETQTLGLQTVRHIVELQLGGTVQVQGSDGVQWSLTLPPETYERRV